MTETDDVVDIHKRFHDATNALDFAAIESMFADDALYVSTGVGSLSGKPAIMDAFRRYFAEYPDQVAIDDVIVATSPTAARSEWRLTATSASTGKPLVRRGVETIEINAAGKIFRADVTDAE